jgi:hypothetical protein
MALDIPGSLVYNPKWWWDPIDMEVFKELEESEQRELVAISVQTQAEILKVQAAGYEKLAATLAKTD